MLVLVSGSSFPAASNILSISMNYVDIAEVSVDQARRRYQSSAAANPTRTSGRFTSFFAALDCFTHSLTEIPDIPIPPRAPLFDVVSMQFCMHYAFESVQKARVMLENVHPVRRPDYCPPAFHASSG